MEFTVTLYEQEKNTLCTTLFNRMVDIQVDRAKAIELDDGANHDALVDEYNDLFAIYKRIMEFSEETSQLAEHHINQAAQTRIETLKIIAS